jgi:hypothetical protein
MSNPKVAEDQGEAFKQLMILKGMTERWGVLHDAQLLQLKMLPMIMIGNCQKVQVDYDCEKREINFIVKTVGKLASAEFFYEKLDEAVKTLLGNTWLVRIKRNGETIFRGPRRAAYKPKKVDSNGSID